MALYHLSNSRLSISVDSKGAELRSLRKRSCDTEYMWDGDPEYWDRTSPVLFPFVGSLKNGIYRYDGKEYSVPKHGFAMDMEFEILRQKENELKFLLRADESTLVNYPFDFELEIGYRFDEEDENKLIVSWRVANRGSREMYFSIGGHPAFLCPLDGSGMRKNCKLLFDVNDRIISSVVGNGSLMSDREREYILQGGMLNVTEDLFKEDALVIEHDQVHSVSLCDGDQPYLTVRFDAPILALWAPTKKGVPFLCVEPWYGRCDSESFAGDLPQREYGNKLAPSAEFHAEYTITVGDEEHRGI